jgi:hypothetical protein
VRRILTHLNIGALSELPGRAPLVTNVEANMRRLRQALIYGPADPEDFVKERPDLFELTEKGRLRAVYDAIYIDGVPEQTGPLSWDNVLRASYLAGWRRAAIARKATWARKRAEKMGTAATADPSTPRSD